MMVVKRNLLFQGAIFGFHLKTLGGYEYQLWNMARIHHLQKKNSWNDGSSSRSDFFLLAKKTFLAKTKKKPPEAMGNVYSGKGTVDGSRNPKQPPKI